MQAVPHFSVHTSAVCSRSKNKTKMLYNKKSIDASLRIYDKNTKYDLNAAKYTYMYIYLHFKVMLLLTQI